MITRITGKIVEIAPECITLDVNGIGYKVYTTKSSNLSPNQALTIYTHYHVSSDNQPSLYGFRQSDALSIFQKLIKISGIGPKIALKIIESDTITNLKNAIIENNINFFTNVKGLGKKGAQKIILELKNVLVEPENISLQSSFAHDALESLGFTNKEINKAISSINITDLSDEEAIEKLLKFLGK